MCVNSVHRVNKCQVYLIVLILKRGDILPKHGLTKKVSDNSGAGGDSKRFFHVSVSNETTKKAALSIGRMGIYLKVMKFL